MIRPREYIVAEGTKSNGDRVQMLIDREDLKENHYTVADYFVPGTQNEQQIGVIQIVGDINLLDISYQNV